MTIAALLIGAVLAIGILSLIPRLPSTALRAGAAIGALLVLLVFVWISSYRYVPESKVGVVVKNALGPSLEAGDIIATGGEKGPQAKILPPGWHGGLWPVIFDVEYFDVLDIKKGEVGIITAVDGRPLPSGEIYAPEWEQDEVSRMLDAQYFLTDGQGYKGPQATVLTPGQYRINPKLFEVKTSPITNVPPAQVAVIKSNIGRLASEAELGANRLVGPDERGIRRTPLKEGEYYLNTDAYEVTLVSTKETIIEFTESRDQGMERAIRVRTSDAFDFPVDVRIVYMIEPENAPLVVSKLRDDKEGLREVLHGSIRSIFRNNAQDVKALDYVQQRVQQEQRSTEMLAEEMTQYGITITAVRIADLGDDSERWQSLLKTQTDREIALQEQETFREQQRAAEQKKELTRTEQEAEEERRLATASYEVQIAEQEKERRIIEAGAEAEAIKIKAEAQANAYELVAQQIGKGNAALVEVLKIVGDQGIQITPRVMVSGTSGAEAGQAETIALIGTMLDAMVEKQQDEDALASSGN